MAKVTVPNIVPDNMADKMTRLFLQTILKILRSDPKTEQELRTILWIRHSNAESTGQSQLPIKQEAEPDGLVILQMEAQFPGGAAILVTVLEQNLNSAIPVDNAAPPGRYTVVVSFVVDKDGTISELLHLTIPGHS